MTAEQFLAFARLFPDPLLLLSSQGRVVACNFAVTTLIGLPYEQLQDRPLTTLVTTSPDQVARYLQNCRRSGAFVLGALTFVVENGRTTLPCRCEGARLRTTLSDDAPGILLRLKPVEDASRNFLLLNQQVDALRTEMRQRQRAEEAERAQRQYFQVTLASIGDGVIVTDPAGVVTFLNRVAESLTGWTMADALGKPVSTVCPLVDEETHQPVENPVVKVLRTGEIVGPMNRALLLSKDGREVPVDDSTAPIRDAQDRLLGVILVFRDITARRQAEEESLRLAAIVASSSDPIISKSLDGVVTSWNAAAERMFGYRAEEIIGQPILRLLPDDRYDEEAKILERLRRGESVEHFETVRRTKDGRLLDVSVTVSPLRNARGTIIGASKVARDITERKRAEAALAQHARDLDRAHTDLRQVAYVSAHDLQEPVRQIGIYTQQIAKRYRDAMDADIQDAIAFVIEGTKRMQAQFTDLMHYLEIEGLGEEITMTDCETVLLHALDALHEPIAVSGATITYDPLPTTKANAKHLQLLFQELLDNAIKFHNSAPPQVHVGAQRQDGYWCFAVRDNGIGIAPSAIGQLFGFFRKFQGRTTYPGTGMGLAICKKIVDRHGGRIWVESVPGEGTTVLFTIQDRR